MVLESAPVRPEEKIHPVVASFLRDETILQNRYKIESLISATGLGHVYKASDLRFPGQLWAIKAFAKFPSNLFLAEMQKQIVLKHPHLIKVVNYFEEQGCSILVMEYVVGRDLQKILDGTSGALPERQVLSWGIQCADALIYLHRRLENFSSYRNLHPKKILISSFGEVKLVPKFSLHLTDFNRAGLVGYSPPEAFEENKLTDERSDLYSLAAILHRCLAGEATVTIPFVFAPLSSLNPSLDPFVGSVIEKATQASPEKRYATLGEFRRELYQSLRSHMNSVLDILLKVNTAGSFWWFLVMASTVSIMLWVYFFFFS